MGWRENKKEYNRQYEKEVLKRVPLNMQKSEYEVIKAAAEKEGKSVNGFIKDCIREHLNAEILSDM